MEQQGIMGLGAQPQQGPSGEELFEAAKTVSPDDYAKGTMESLRMQDPESAAMVDQIMSMQLPSNLVEALLELIDMIFQDPQNYPAIRQESIAAGVPEEILPPEFDIEYFAMLQMALRAAPRGPATPEMPDEPEMNMMAPQMGMPGMGQAPQQFAMGGEVSGDPKMKMVAQYLQDQGRYGDTMLAHINPQEAAMLKQMGGSGTINPYTGLPEFIKGISFKKQAKKLGNTFKSAGSAVVDGLKSVGKAVQKIAKTPIGKIAIGVGLAIATVATGGAAAGAAGLAKAGIAVSPGVIAGVAGGMGASVLAGDKPSDVVKNAVIGGFAGYGAGQLGVTGFSGAPSAVGTPKFFQTAQDLGSKVYKAGKDLVGGAGKMLGVGGGEGEGGGSGLKDALLYGGLATIGTTLAAGGFDQKNPTVEDLGMGFDGSQTPTQKGLSLIEQDPEKYKVNLGEVTESRTQDPYGDAGADSRGYTGFDPTTVPTIKMPDQTATLPQVDTPTVPVPSAQNPFLPYASEMLTNPEVMALADQYNVDLDRGFAQGGLVQAFAKGGKVTSSREFQRQAELKKKSPSRSSVASQIAKSRVNSATNTKPANVVKANRAQDKKFSPPPSNKGADNTSFNRKTNAQRVAASQPKSGAATRAEPKTLGRVSPVAAAQSSQMNRATTAVRDLRDTIAAQQKRPEVRPPPVENPRAAPAPTRPAPVPTRPAPAPMPTPAPAPMPTPAPAPMPTPAPAPVFSPPPSFTIGGATPTPAPMPMPTPAPAMPPPSVGTPPPVFGMPPSVGTPPPVSTMPPPSVGTPPPVFGMPPSVGTPDTSFPGFGTPPSVGTPPPVFGMPPSVGTPDTSFPGFGTPSNAAMPVFPGFSNEQMETPFRFAQGGVASTGQPVYGYVGGGTPQYPNRDGEIAGPGTGTSDDIPAMLSDGEFVFTAKAVRNMGGGDRKEGAKRMYAMMKKLEGGGMA